MAEVVSISGRTRAGKTTLAEALGSALGWPWASFSSYIKSEAKRRGLPLERRALQDLGAELIEELGWAGFVEAMLADRGLDPTRPPFIIEGVRHRGTLEGLREVVAPTRVVAIYLDVSDSERNRRLAAEGISPAEGAEWERHSTEFEVLNYLPNEADLVVDADEPATEVAKNAEKFLRQEKTA